MTDYEAERRLRTLLHTRTAGSILHLLAQLSIEGAEGARRNGNELLYQRLAGRSRIDRRGVRSRWACPA